MPPSLVNIYKELHDDLGIDDAEARQPRVVGAPGCAAAQHHAHRAGGRGGIASGQGLGDVHRRGVCASSTTSRSCRVHPVGLARPQEEGADRHVAPHRDRVRAPVAAVSAHNGFFGSKPFSRTNAALVEAGLAPIDWRLPDLHRSHPSVSGRRKPIGVFPYTPGRPKHSDSRQPAGLG